MVHKLIDYSHFQAELTEQVPGLMNAIRMIYSISGYYNTSERMTSLFVKVTNQMITMCKAYITRDVSRIWELPRWVVCCTCMCSYSKHVDNSYSFLRLIMSIGVKNK